MSSESPERRSECVLVHAPFGRDAALICGVLEQAGIEARACSSMEALCQAVRDGAGAILVGDEALRPEGFRALQTVIQQQPPWSDLPVFVMTSGRGGNERHPSRLGLFEALGNVTLLERPLRAETIVSAFRMALRSRAHQYQNRDHLAAERRLFAEAQGAKSALERSNAELRRANEDLNQFAYSASHDLREPLRMITVYSQMLQRKYGPKLDEEAAQYLAYSVQGAKRMDLLIRDLLTYTQAVDSGDHEVTPVNCGEVFKQAVENLQSVIQDTKGTVESAPLPVVIAKRTHLLQLFQNLIANALKYRSERPPDIHVSAQQEDGMWKICVRDNGIGIETEYADQVFGLFKRLHGGGSGYEGTGIGLAICQKIVERYGGRIWVASEGPGRGSTFCFTVPGVTSGTADQCGGNRLK